MMNQLAVMKSAMLVEKGLCEKHLKSLQLAVENELETGKLVEKVHKHLYWSAGTATPVALIPKLEARITQLEDALSGLENPSYVLVDDTNEEVRLVSGVDDVKLVVEDMFADGWSDRSEVEDTEMYLVPIFDNLRRTVELTVAVTDFEMSESMYEDDEYAVFVSNSEWDTFSDEDDMKDAVLELLNDGEEYSNIRIEKRRTKSIDIDSNGNEKISVMVY